MQALKSFASVFETLLDEATDSKIFSEDAVKEPVDSSKYWRFQMPFSDVTDTSLKMFSTLLTFFFQLELI